MFSAIWNISADTLVLTLGAVTAAGIAAVTAQWRLRAQLSNDRTLRFREEAREVVNEALEEAIGAGFEAGAALAADSQSAHDEAKQQAWGHYLRMTAVDARLATFFHEQHEITATYRALDGALEALIEGVSAAGYPVGENEQRECDLLVQAADRTFDRFKVACRTWAQQ